MITKDCRLIKWLKHFSLKSLQTAKLLTTISQLRQLCFSIPFPFLNNSTWTLFSCLPNFYLSLLQLFPFYWQFCGPISYTHITSFFIPLPFLNGVTPSLYITHCLSLKFALPFSTILDLSTLSSTTLSSFPFITTKRTLKFWTICKAFYWFV